MSSFRIEEIYGDGYERWIKVIACSLNIENLVYFLEYDEYLENGNNISKRRKGDIINGNIKIDLIIKYKLIDNDKSGFV